LKERYQDIDDKNDALRELLADHPKHAEFMSRFERAWVYHDNALEGVVYNEQEIGAGLDPSGAPPEASLLPAVVDIRNHKAAIDYIREEARTSGRGGAGSTASAAANPSATYARQPPGHGYAAQLDHRIDGDGLGEGAGAGRAPEGHAAAPRTSTTSRSRRRDPGPPRQADQFTRDDQFREYHPIKQARPSSSSSSRCSRSVSTRGRWPG
jgi:hypothetical protein